MYVERLLQINMATLAALATLLLGMGQRSTALPLLMMVAAILSVWLTDVTGWLRLNRAVANLAALAAVVLSLRELLRVGGGSDVLGLANLLVYLQIVLLFQKKNERVYWELAVLSLLQVVVAAAYNQGAQYGLLLILYMLTGISALALLSTYRQWQRSRPEAKSPRPPGGAGRWPLDRRPSSFAGTAAGRPHSALGREWFARLATMGFGTLVVAALMFFAVPRVGARAWRGAVAAARQVVGFDDRVVLGELGQIIESREEVMRVWLSDPTSGEPHPMLSELYLRGVVLARYEDCAWSPGENGPGSVGPLAVFSAPKPMPNHPLVQQKIEILPTLDHNELFAIWPFLPIELNRNLWIDRPRSRLVRPNEQRFVRFDYKLGTTALDGNVQVPLVPCEDVREVESLLQSPELPRLDALAAEWIRHSGLPPEDRIARARVLERRFHDPNLFQYSLEGQQRDPKLDNIEDFLTKNPRGHCEYFATALVLMLRSQGIPARMVIGYRCDEYDRLGDFYQVRQLHAHSWVEAYLEPEHVPDELFNERPRRWAAGGWLRLEPTPGALGSAAAGDTLFGRVDRGVRRLQSLWENYVMDMDRRRQWEAVYRPVADAVSGAFKQASDPQWWLGLPSRIWRLLSPGAWFAAGGWWRWLVAVVAIGSAVVVLTRFAPQLAAAARWLWNWLARLGVSKAGRRRTEIEFYGRLESVLGRHGLVRRVGQTQYEFAAAAGERIAAISGRRRLALLPRQVVDAFYRVRFGHLPLDSTLVEAVESALAELETVE